MDGLQRIETAKTALSEGLAAIDKDIQAKSEKSRVLHEEHAKLERTVSELKADFEQEKADLGGKITKNREILQKLTADIEQANKDLEKALAELRAAKKQHKEFMDYRKRANTVLETRESAILDKEKKLDVILSTAQRRTKILANI